jgi:pimeloyl-ACP methyl ester carboxylesterase
VKTLASCLRIAVLSYVGIALLVMVGQRWLLYRPSRIPTEVLTGLASERRMIPWTNLAGLRIGWQRPCRLGHAEGAVLILHGNAGTAIARDYFADPLQEALPLDVFVLEYPGYADRPGSPSQNSLLAAAKDAAELLRDRTHLFLVGESLGSGVASYLAGTLGTRVAGLLLIVPFNHLSAAAAVHYPWLPVRWLLWDKFPSDEWLRDYSGPAAFLLAGNDQLVPPALGHALYEGYHGPKRLWEIPKAGHEDVVDRPASWWREVGDFWGLKSDSQPPKTRGTGSVP